MSILNLEEMLGESMQEVEAAPNYVTLETGSYILVVKDTDAKKMKAKDEEKAKKEGKPTEFVQLQHLYEVEEVLSTEGNAMPVAAGSLTTDTWQFTEQGKPYFKSRTVDIAVANGEDGEAIGALSAGDMLQGVKGMRFKCTATKTPRSDNPAFFNVRISNISPAE